MLQTGPKLPELDPLKGSETLAGLFKPEFEKPATKKLKKKTKKHIPAALTSFSRYRVASKQQT